VSRYRPGAGIPLAARGAVGGWQNADDKGGDVGRTRVVLLFGGRSSEHEVSCVSARHVAAAMEPERYEVVPVGITKDGRFVLPPEAREVLAGGALRVPDEAFLASGEPVSFLQDPTRRSLVLVADGAAEIVGPFDAAFPVLHGPYGEDGCVQGLLELAGIPYVGSGVLGSAMGMDKEKMKLAFRSVGLTTAAHLVVLAPEWAARRQIVLATARELGFPLFVKPANLGSSVGVGRCTDAAGLEDAIGDALRYDRKVLVEEGIQGREIECSVLGNDDPEASVPGEIIPGGDFYDYAAKYLEDTSKLLIPAPLPATVADTVRAQAVGAFRAVDAAGMARVDFFYEEEGRARGVVVNEINTIPGFTSISMYPKLWEASGLPYPRLIDRLLELALERAAARPHPEAGPPAEG
jgi:D-alanine-D-alanine ligase